MPGVEGRTRGFVGRRFELALLQDLLDGAEQGNAGVVVVDGESGIGKSTLAAQMCTTAATRGFTVLSGACVNFAAAQVPYAPVARAVREWADRGGQDGSLASQATRIFGADGLTSRSDPGAPGLSAQVILATDELVRALAAQAPVILVIDDLQWCDVASLDLLGYLATGLRGRRVGMLLLIRTEDRPTGHRLHPWLADLRRLENVRELTLERMTEAETAAQVAALRPGLAPGLGAAVHARTAGNPYFTELLASGLDVSDAAVPDRAPNRLRDAVLARWHGLSETSRWVTRVLAVGGRPRREEDLARVVAQLAPDVDAGASVRESVAAGVLVEDPPGTLWLRHPLLTEVLLEPQPGDRDQATHLAFAALLADAQDRDPLASCEIVEHLRAAGDVDGAFTWALVAADESHLAGAHSESCRALALAADLWPQVAPDLRGDDAAHIALLRRTALAECLMGEDASSRAHLDRAILLVDERTAPLLAAELALEREATLDVGTELRKELSHELVHALHLSEAHLDSETHLVTLAVVAQARVVDDDPDQEDHLSEAVVRPGLSAARRALEGARRTGSRRALAWATWAMGTVERGSDDDAAAALFAEAYALSRSEEDFRCASWAAGWWSHALLALGRYDAHVEMAEGVGAELAAAGDVETHRGLAADAAMTLIRTGEWSRALEMLRSTVGSHGLAAVLGAWASAALAVRSGGLESARRHIERLNGLDAVLFPAWQLAQPEAELHIATGDPSAALDVLRRRHERNAWAEGPHAYLSLAAAACVDLVESAPDGERVAQCANARATIDQMRHWEDEAGPPRVLDPRFVGVWRARERAEFARLDAALTGSADVIGAFEGLRDAAREAGFPWEEAYAGWRLGEALVRARAPKASIASALRDGHDVADRLGAAPLAESIRRLAEAARISLALLPPTSGFVPEEAPAGVLTNREREVLTHLVAGRTNAEIAADLFISVKTAGIHVSNILRKTGTHSRAEAALWAAQHDEK